MPESSLRPVDTRYATQSEPVSFADGFPFLLISEASLQDLNERLDEPISMNRFRPNLVISGCEPFAEDSWDSIRIGTIAFRVVKPCDRCIVTTVEQTTGIRSKEPLQTLVDTAAGWKNFIRAKLDCRTSRNAESRGFCGD
jgi:uncharacterized protein YcbX